MHTAIWLVMARIGRSMGEVRDSIRDLNRPLSAIYAVAIAVSTDQDG